MMTDFLLASANLPFTISLGLMIGIALMEGVTTLLGFALSDMVDSAFPDIDMDVDADIDMDVDADADVDADGFGSPLALSNILSWLNVGRVPMLILFLLFLFSFGLAGLTIQSMFQNYMGNMLNAAVATFPSFICGLIFVRYAGDMFARLVPKDETEAVSEDSFLGQIAIITLGTAEKAKPAQAKLRDEFGRTHYVMVAPDADDMKFETGTEVVLVARSGAVFLAVPNTTGVSFSDLGPA